MNKTAVLSLTLDMSDFDRQLEAAEDQAARLILSGMVRHKSGGPRMMLAEDFDADTDYQDGKLCLKVSARCEWIDGYGDVRVGHFDLWDLEGV